MSLLGVASASAAGCSSEPVADDNLGVVSQALNSGFRLPFNCGFNTTVTQGNDSAFSHNGVSRYGFDFGVPLNTPLVATKAGRVAFARNDVKPGNPCYSGGGSGCVSTLNYATVDHGDGTSTVYAHMNSVSVTVGQMVTQGQVLGLSGGTGWSTGPHTHLQRQQNCGIFYCQSIPMSFDDVAGAGVPVAGQAVKSQNNCTGDCLLGDGHYCGNNGVKGDPAAVYLCTGGVPKVVKQCEYGCLKMPTGIDDRCATAEEAPLVDAGADAPAESAAPDMTPPSVAKPEPGEPGATPTSGTLRPELEMANDGCTVTHSAPARSTFPALGLAALLGLTLVRRRRPTAR